MLHDLWECPELGDGGYLTFCLTGPMGDDARARLSSSARLTWTVGAASNFEAMTLFYEHMGWGESTTNYPETDRQTYAERGWE